jgi:hypothetical protein
MSENNIDNFDIKDGQIRYKTEVRKQPISQKTLLSILAKHPQLGEEQAVALNSFIFENRPEVLKESIVRKTKPVNSS